MSGARVARLAFLVTEAETADAMGINSKQSPSRALGNWLRGNRGRIVTAKSWTARLADWAKRCWNSNDPDVQDRIGIRDVGGDIIEQTANKIDYVYGGPHGAPHMRVFANGDPHLDVMRSVAERMWQLPVKGEVVTANGVSDLRTACPHCGVMVRIPCTEGRARNCRNRRTR